MATMRDFWTTNNEGITDHHDAFNCVVSAWQAEFFNEVIDRTVKGRTVEKNKDHFNEEDEDLFKI